jgi:hypothetical protein
MLQGASPAFGSGYAEVPPLKEVTIEWENIHLLKKHFFLFGGTGV